MDDLNIDNIESLLAGIETGAPMVKATQAQMAASREYNEKLSERIGNEERARQAASIEQASRMYLTL